VRRFASYAADPSRAPEWYANISSVEWETPPPVGVGSRLRFVAHFLGRRLAYTYEVVEAVSLERLVMRTAQGPFPMETTYTWTTVDERRTRMTLRNRGEPSGFAGVAAPLMVRAMRRVTRRTWPASERCWRQGRIEGPAGPGSQRGGDEVVVRYRFLDGMGDVVAEAEFEDHASALRWARDDEENDEEVQRVEFLGPEGDWRWAGPLLD